MRKMKMKYTPSILKTVSQVSAAALLFAASPALAEDPTKAPNNSWVSVSGEVKSVTPSTFELDYDKGVITVEFDDWDADADAYKLIPGDQVTVTGKIDNDLFETRKIEGSTVYVDSINTYFYASAADEEDAFVTIVAPVDGTHTTLQGTVTSVEDDEFNILAGTSLLTVEIDEMPYNPLDDKGYQKIEVGDRVSVNGEFDRDFIEGLELKADAILTLSNNG
jgi:uncharacterized protein YdeI (BOF family)